MLQHEWSLRYNSYTYLYSYNSLNYLNGWIIWILVHKLYLDKAVTKKTIWPSIEQFPPIRDDTPEVFNDVETHH